MICSACQFENPPQMKFCVACGVAQQVDCGACGARMHISYRFCGECGTSLNEGAVPVPAARPAAASTTPAAPSPTPAVADTDEDAASGSSATSADGERKQVTVLSCELTTPSGYPLSPEVLHELLSSFFEVAQDEVVRLGGTINRFLGQGFMALFGAPKAYEDHPRRGILAALALKRVVIEHAQRIDTPYTIRVGVDTGFVVVGGIGGMAVGEATEIAGRLESLAEPGEILVSDNSARLARAQANLEKHGSIEGLGGESLALWRASNLDLNDDSRFASPSSITPFVGRERELAVLEQLRDQATEGHGQVVALAGEPGSGKSRLLHEFYLRTFPGQKGVSYLRGECVSYASGVPYLPLIHMIRRASQIKGSDTSEGIAAKLKKVLERVQSDSEETLPLLLRLLGVKEGTESLNDLEPLALQAKTFAAMRRMIMDAGRQSLVVLEMENLQWADATTQDFLNSLVEAMAACRLLVLVTYRDGHKPQWLEKSYTTQLTMSRLSRPDSREMIGYLLEDVDEKVVDEILEKAEGNPFFLEEVARSMAAGDEGDGAVPDTIQGILNARVDRLPDQHKSLLKNASVLGRELPLTLVEKVWPGSPDDLLPLLQDLQRWELIYQAPSEDHVTFFFRQALTQEMVYQSLLKSKRQELHHKVATSLEEMYADRLPDVYDRLVYHYPKAGEPTKTVHYLTLFAQRAADSYAHSEAAQALRQALEQAVDLPEPDRDRKIFEVLLQLAESLLPLASFPETLELFLKYLEPLEALGDPALSGPYYFWLAHTYTYLGLQEETRDFAEKSIAAAREAEDETTEGKARYVLGRDGFWSGQFQKGIENSLRAVVLLERNGEPWWQGQAYWVAGFNHYVLGQFDQAIDALERTLGLGDVLGDYRLDASWSLGYFYASLGEADMGIEQCRGSLERSQDPLNSGVSMGFLGHAMWQKGEDLEQALKHLEGASELMGKAGMQQLEGWFCAFLGEALLTAERLEDAERTAARGLEASEAAKFRYGVGLSESAVGRIHLRGGRHGEARKSLENALGIFEELEVPLEVARLQLDLATLAREEGQGDNAEALFDESLGRFRDLKVPYWIARAEEVSSAAG